MLVQNPWLLCLSRTASEPFTAEESDTMLSTVSSPEGPEHECEANQYVLPNDISWYLSKVAIMTTAAC